MPSTPLGKKLLDTLKGINDLLQKASDPGDINKLMEQRDRVNKQIDDELNKALDLQSQEYKDVTDALDAAKQKIQGTLDDFTSIATTITTVASALDQVASLLAKA